MIESRQMHSLVPNPSLVCVWVGGWVGERVRLLSDVVDTPLTYIVLRLAIVPPSPGKVKPSYGNTQCDRCSHDQYANDARTACVPCPPVGVTCMSGILHMLPGSWAPLSFQGTPVQPDTPLFECMCVAKVASVVM